MSYNRFITLILQDGMCVLAAPVVINPESNATIWRELSPGRRTNCLIKVPQEGATVKVGVGRSALQ